MLLVLVVLVAFFVFEAGLLWASTALGNVEVNWGKICLITLVVTAVWATASAAAGYGMNGVRPVLAPDNRLWGGIALAIAVLISWAVPALLYAPLLPVSVPRGMLISVFQVLLRVFLYTLVAAVVMVVLAVLQIRYGPQKTEGPGAAPPARVARA
jgi:hypothetical protein